MIIRDYAAIHLSIISGLAGNIAILALPPVFRSSHYLGFTTSELPVILNLSP